MISSWRFTGVFFPSSVLSMAVDTWESFMNSPHFHVDGGALKWALRLGNGSLKLACGIFHSLSVWDPFLAELVYGVPNDGSEAFVNALGGAVVLVDRGGGVSLVDKVLRAQEAGAIAVVIADTGECSPTFECGRALGSRAEGKMAHRDGREVWEDVFIPCVLITRQDADRLRAQLTLTEMHVSGMGLQRFLAD